MTSDCTEGKYDYIFRFARKVCIIFAILGLLLFALVKLSTMPRIIARLDLGSNRTAHLAVGSGLRFHYNSPILCRIIGERKQNNFDWTYVGRIEELDSPEGAREKLRSLQFSTVVAADGELVGIVESEKPDVIIDLIDFRTHERLSDKIYSKRWTEERLNEMNAAYPGRSFQLNSCTVFRE